MKNSLSAKSRTNHRFDEFQSNYLLVYLLAMFSDWLQGPYIYELYVSYGFKEQQIAELFVCGFASSMIVGTFVGGLADTIGRKKACMLYCVSYSLACITKLVPNYWCLMLGRFLSGLSTSLLFSVFESWMVCEHTKKGFDLILLGQTFAFATFGNGAVGVIGGLVANTAAEMFGYVAPFVFALVPLVLTGVLIASSWTENYGTETSNPNILESLASGFNIVRSDPSIAALGMSQSLFEGSMYTFIFMWTPALHVNNTKRSSQMITEKEDMHKSINGTLDGLSQYLGLIFAVFMMCSMIGSSIFQLYAEKKDVVFAMPILIHIAAMIAMSTVAVCLEDKVIIIYLSFPLSLQYNYTYFNDNCDLSTNY